MKSKLKLTSKFICEDDFDDFERAINRVFDKISKEQLVELKEIHDDYYKYNLLIVYETGEEND